MPKNLPILRKSQKVIKILKYKNIIEIDDKKFSSEELASQLLEIIVRAENNNLDVENILMRKLKNLVYKNAGDFLEA